MSLGQMAPTNLHQLQPDWCTECVPLAGQYGLPFKSACGFHLESANPPQDLVPDELVPVLVPHEDVRPSKRKEPTSDVEIQDLIAESMPFHHPQIQPSPKRNKQDDRVILSSSSMIKAEPLISHSKKQDNINKFFEGYCFGRFLRKEIHGNVFVGYKEGKEFTIKASENEEASLREEQIIQLINKCLDTCAVTFHTYFYKYDTVESKLLHCSVYDGLDGVLDDYMHSLAQRTTIAARVNLIAEQLLNALVVLYTNGVICGELCPQSIGVKWNVNSLLIRLVDFKTSIKEPKYPKVFNDLLTDPSYRAPEVNLAVVPIEIVREMEQSLEGREKIKVLRKQHADIIGYGVDMWSFGVMLLEICSPSNLRWTVHCFEDKTINVHTEAISSLIKAVNLVGEVPQDLWDHSWMNNRIPKNLITPSFPPTLESRCKKITAYKQHLVPIIKQALCMDPRERVRIQDVYQNFLSYIKKSNS